MPGSTKTVKGEGMPISRTPTVRGDLIIRFDTITFPRTLSEDKRRALRALLT